MKQRNLSFILNSMTCEVGHHCLTIIRQVEPAAPIESKPMTDQERAEAIKRQVEYYFSRQNLLQVRQAIWIRV